MKTRACYIRPMEPTIALFDIDGTLLRAGGAGRRAVELALCEVLDDIDGNVSLESVEFAGRTDPWNLSLMNSMNQRFSMSSV